MDTIIKLCYTHRQEGIKGGRPEYELQSRKIQDYQLIQLLIREALPAPGGDGRAKGAVRAISGLRHCLWERRQRKARAGLGERLREELAPLLDGYGENALVYEGDVPRESWVRELLPLPEFDGYFRREWLQRLLPYAVHPHYVILGSAPCLQEMLRELAPGMKSILWIAPDPGYQEQLEEFVEEFFLEYGLAINLHFVPDNGTFAQMRIQDDRYREPVNVLDFTGEKYIPCFEPPKGSVWLDMASVREKERRIEARRLNAAYFSLKKQWRDKSPKP